MNREMTSHPEISESAVRFDRSEYDRKARQAVERLDVLEDELPRGTCAVKGCERSPRYEWAGTFGIHYLCPTHRRAYREHDRILKRIRDIESRS